VDWFKNGGSWCGGIRRAAEADELFYASMKEVPLAA
jgi:hypothetical protein